jgi:cytochrome d ubiquinol oxidase subunit I
VLSYEIGTNWSVFAERTSHVIGPFFSYEALTAFFLEAGSIGVMLFGMNRVGPRLHFLACVTVAAGAIFSAFWILAANSWMQTPAGYTMNGDHFEIASWMAAIFTPSFPYRLAHMVAAAYLTGAFTVIGVMGWYLWRGRHVEFASAGFSVAMWIAAILAPAQILLGDMHGLNTLHYQPVKVAAMEGDWETRAGQPLVLFGWPDMRAERNDYALDIPGLGSLILTHHWNGEVPGLKSVPPDQRPYVPIVFWAFRLMVACGLALLAIAWTGLWLRWRGRLYDTRWFSAIAAVSSPIGFFAILCGWTVTETGRQPWVVYGQLRTVDAIAPVAAHSVALSLALFVVIYAILLLAFFYYAMRTVLAGPRATDSVVHPDAVRPGLDTAAADAR